MNDAVNRLGLVPVLNIARKPVLALDDRAIRSAARDIADTVRTMPLSRLEVLAHDEHVLGEVRQMAREALARKQP